MHSFSTLATLALFGCASAHTLMYGIWVNGQDQGDGRRKYIRSPPNDDPLVDATQPSINCNVKGTQPVDDFVPVAAGDDLTFEWYHDNRGDDIIDLSHLGPILTYIAEYSDEATGAIWTKIDEEGYEGNKWAVEKLVENKGMKKFKLPSELKAGKYIIRQEVIGLHEGETDYQKAKSRGAQFYPSCVQVEVTKGGKATPSDNVDLTEYYVENKDGIVFDIYNSYASYPIPGPKVNAKLSGSGSDTTAPADPVESEESSAIASPTSTPDSCGSR